MSDLARRVGERLRNYRLQEGYSQDALAERAGVHPTYIGQLERGEKNATLESIEKIADSLNLPLAKLFEGIPPKGNVSDIPAECYRLIQALPVKKQEQLFEILKAVIVYRES